MNQSTASIEGILADAVEIVSPAERRAFVGKACAGDAKLEVRVQRLIDDHFRAGSFLERPLVLPETAALVVPNDAAGTQIGPYKLLEQIGEGGMGLVFVAEQLQPVRRMVALKLIKPGMDSQQVIARFEAERQALALMDHPNIAKVLDAGTTDGGRPYFVMELVRGIPITKYCDQARMKVRQRLEVFVRVCRAIQHAHTKGIIHRDLKPSNVLVTSHDGIPVPVVIDFGVAKALGQQLTERTLHTGFAQMIGTPLYMSPEQAEFNQLGVDTRSDVYSLGVLLYELLTGTTPFDGARLKTADYDEFRRILREEEPPRPSARLSTLGELLTTASERRGVDGRKLTQTVHGELDWIVLRAMEKDRTRRYESASAFADDIDRLLNDEAVSACPPSVVYRGRKFVRRHKVALGIAAMAAGTLAVAFGSVVGSIYDRQLRRTLVAGQVRAALEEASDLMGQGRLRDANAAVKRAEGLLAGASIFDELLLAQQWRSDLDMVARLEQIRLETSETRNDIIDYHAADRAYSQAFQEFGIDVDSLDAETAAERIRLRPVSRELATAIDVWSGVRKKCRGAGDGGRRRLLTVARLADPDPWRSDLRRAIEAEDRATLLRLAAVNEIERQPPESTYLLGRSLGDMREVQSAAQVLLNAQRQHPSDFWLNFELGIARNRQGANQLPEVVRFYSVAVSLRPESALARSHLASALANWGRRPAAFAAAQEAIRLDPQSAAVRYTLGKLCQDEKRIGDSIVYFKEAIRLRPSYFEAYVNLGAVLAMSGRHDEAIEAHREAIRLNPNRSEPYFNLGITLKQKGDLDGAVDASRNALRLAPSADNVRINLGNLLFSQNKVDEAIALHREAIRLNPKSAMAHNNLGNALATIGQHAEGIAERREAIRLNPDCFVAHFNLCLHLVAVKEDPKEVLREFERAVRDARGDEAACEGGFYLAMALAEAGDKAMARTWFNTSVSRLDKSGLQVRELQALRSTAAKALGIAEPQKANAK